MEKIKDFFRKILIRLQLRWQSDLLQSINKELGEGVISWNYLNTIYELKFGTAKTARKKLNAFKEFVEERWKLYQASL